MNKQGLMRAATYEPPNPSFAYHKKQPTKAIDIIKPMKALFKDYYGKPIYDNYMGVQYVAYDKEYTDEALDLAFHEIVRYRGYVY